MREIGVQKLIVLRSGCRDDECCNLVARLGGQVIKRIPFVGAVAVSRLSEEAVRAVSTHHDVESVEDDIPVYALGAVASRWGRTDVKARARPPFSWPASRSAGRLPKVERTVLRMAVYELLHMEETPSKVVLNEAIELSKTFGDEKSSRFVNGVLSKYTD